MKFLIDHLIVPIFDLIKDLRSVLNLTVLVAGLGYFVDLFDITLYGVVRVASLKSLGVTDPAAILSSGILIYNSQMIGMMLGGLLWGMLADRRGRLSVMFGSILIYSIANIANSFAWDPVSYAVCRFVSGLGLAGELGAAVTLVAESLPKEKRGLGTTLVATLGMLGIVAAALIGQKMQWQFAYAMGGVLGLLLLFARFKISESSLFQKAKGAGERGNFLLLFKSGRWQKYLGCIAVGVPIYFTTGVLFTFAPELTSGLGVVGTVTAGDAILYGSIGLTLGDFASGLLSHWLRSRRLAISLCLVAGLSLLLVYVLAHGLTSDMVYALSFMIGLTVGYWAVLVTIAAEQFGTNIRATVATTVPNFVRGSAVIATTGFAMLKNHLPAAQAALIIGVICFGVALIALYKLDETFGRDLNYEEL
jgi:MFS family permease